MPERFTTTFSTTLNVYIPAGYATAAAGNYMDVCVNSVSSPFQFGCTYTATQAPAPTYAFHGSLVQGDVLGQVAMGYTAMASLYMQYKVHSFKLAVTAQPGAASDPMQLVVIPLGAEEIPSSSAGQVNSRVLSNQPNCVTKVCASGVPASLNTARVSHKVWDILGLRQQQYLDFPNALLSAIPSYPCYAGIFLQGINGSNNASPVTVQIVLEQVVELSDLIQPIN